MDPLSWAEIITRVLTQFPSDGLLSALEASLPLFGVFGPSTTVWTCCIAPGKTQEEQL